MHKYTIESSPLCFVIVLITSVLLLRKALPFWCAKSTNMPSFSNLSSNSFRMSHRWWLVLHLCTILLLQQADGVGRLLFEMFKGVPGQLHNITSTVSCFACSMHKHCFFILNLKQRRVSIESYFLSPSKCNSACQLLDFSHRPYCNYSN